MTQQNLDDLSDLYKAVGLPFVVVDQAGEEQAAFPYAFEGIYKKEFLSEMVCLLQAVRPHGVMLQATTDFYYLAVTQIGELLFLVSAPISNIAENTNVSPIFSEWVTRERLAEYVHMVVSLPGMTNFQLSKFAALAKRLCSGFTSDGTGIHQIGSQMLEPIIQRNTSIPNAFEERDRGRHQTYEFEHHYLKAIEAGDEQQLTQWLSRPVYGVLGRMSLNSLRQSKYLFVCCIYASSRAAIRGGVPTEHSFQLSDSYCQRMDGMNTVAEVDQLREQVIFEYCRLVQQYQKKKNYCYTTRLCCEYIREHLYDKITIEDLTHLAHLNRRSLTIYFKQDTGKGIPEYINDERLEEAKFLLVQTDMPLVEISELLHFCNQSYFCRKFREKYGVSPNSLRKS